MRHRRQIIRKINVLSKRFFVKLYDDSIKTLKFTKKKFFFLNFYVKTRKIRFYSNYSFSKRIVFVQLFLISFFRISNFEMNKKKRQSLISFFNIINRDFLILRIIFVSITIIESKNFYFNNKNQSINQRTKQNIINFNNFDNFTNFSNFTNFTFIIITKN